MTIQNSKRDGELTEDSLPASGESFAQEATPSVANIQL
jgi:hypothetical protein